MAGPAAADLREILPDPVLQHVGRHLSLSAMRTCRLVCKRWAVVIGESVTAVGAGADALRDAVLRGDGRGGALALLGRHRLRRPQKRVDPAARGSSPGVGEPTAEGLGDSSSSSSDDDGDSDTGSQGSDGGRGSDGGADGDAGAGERRRRASARAAMRRLRRQSARLARAFPRAHTAVLHVDVGYGDRAAPDPAEAAGRVAALLCGQPNLSRVRLAVRALGAADDDVADDPDAALDNEYTFAFTMQFLSCLLLRPPPREARALPPTAAALRRRRAMLPGVPWGGGAGGLAAAASSHSSAVPPCWALELHLGAMPADPAAWADLSALPQLATLLLPAQQPRLPAAALPALAACTGLRALRLSVAGFSSAAGGAGVGVLAEPGAAPAAPGHADALCAQVAELSRLTALTHLALHANALPSRPLSAAIAALSGLRDLFVSGGAALDVAALVRPPGGRRPGLTALERLALPQPLTLGELALLSASCARLRHVEAAGVWEACLGECATARHGDSAAAPAPAAEAAAQAPAEAESPVRALLALPPPHAAEDGAAAAAPAGAPDGQAEFLAAAAGAAGGAAPPEAAGAAAWFHAQLAASAAWTAILADGWAALQLPAGAQPLGGTAPTDPWAVLASDPPASPAVGAAQHTAAAQVALLLGVTRALNGFTDSPHEAASEAGVLQGLRMHSCSYQGVAVSALAVLAAALASARRGPPGMAAAAYDAADPVTLRGAALPAGAADRLLDGLHAADPPDPSGGGDSDSGSGSDDDDGSGGSNNSHGSNDGEGGGNDGVGGRSSVERHAVVSAGFTGQSCGDDSSGGKGGVRSAAPARERRRRRRHGGRAGEPRGVTSFFTWAGVGADLGPLGAALPRLERLSIALPPSIASMAAAGIASNTEWPSPLPELVISFGGGADSSHRSSDCQRGSSAGVAVGDGNAQCGASEPAPLAAPAAFPALRHLSIGALTAPSAQFDPGCSIGDAALRAIAAGLPALEALQLDGDLCLTGAGLARLSALTRLRSLALHAWTDTLLPLEQQLVRVPALSLPPGLTALRAINVQLDPPPPPPPPATAASADAAGLAGEQPHDDALARRFGGLVTLELAHGDHSAADRLLDLALPRMAAALEALHVSGPCAFRHTPAGAALAYGAAFGAEAVTGFALPIAQLLAGLRARRCAGASGSAGSGTTWLRHIAGLRALADLHIDAPLASPAQVRELVDALVRRGGVHTLAVHGLTVSLVTRRTWLVRQLSRLSRLGLQSVSLSFGRHALVVVPSWLRRGGGAGGGEARAPAAACPADVHMLEALAAAFKATPDAHFTIASDDGVEESAHSVPWGLPLPQQSAGGGGGAGGGVGGPIAEGAEFAAGAPAGAAAGAEPAAAAAAAAAAPPPPAPQDGEPRLPRGLRIVARVLAFCIGPRNAVEMLSRALLPAMVAAAAGDPAGDPAAGGGGVPAAWGVHAMVVDAIAPFCEPDRVAVPEAVVSLARPSLALAMFLLGALSTLIPAALLASALVLHILHQFVS